MGCPMSAASPIAGALLPAPCSVWDPRAPRAPGAVATCPAALPLAFLPASPGPSCRAGTLHAQAKPGQAQQSPSSPRRHFWGVHGQALPPGLWCEQAGCGHGSAGQQCGVPGGECSAGCWGVQCQLLGGAVPAAAGLCRAIGCSSAWGGGAVGCSASQAQLYGAQSHLQLGLRGAVAAGTAGSGCGGRQEGSIGCSGGWVGGCGVQLQAGQRITECSGTRGRGWGCSTSQAGAVYPWVGAQEDTCRQEMSGVTSPRWLCRAALRWGQP